MINKRFYLEVESDPYNRYIISGDPRDDFINISRQKRNHRSHGYTVLSEMQFPIMAGIAAVLDVTEAMRDACNLTGVLREGNQVWLDDFIKDKYTEDNGVRASNPIDVAVTFVEF